MSYFRSPIWIAVVVLLSITSISQIAVVWSFSPQGQAPTTHRLSRTTRSRLYSTEEAGNNEELILGDDVQSEMSKVRSKYPVSENAYLAAAKARAQAQTESSKRRATDEDWQEIAKQKKAELGGAEDDGGWEASKDDEGMQILMPDLPSEASGGGEEGGEEEDPKLMLF